MALLALLSPVIPCHPKISSSAKLLAVPKVPLTTHPKYIDLFVLANIAHVYCRNHSFLVFTFQILRTTCAARALATPPPPISMCGYFTGTGISYKYVHGWLPKNSCKAPNSFQYVHLPKYARVFYNCYLPKLVLVTCREKHI